MGGELPISPTASGDSGVVQFLLTLEEGKCFFSPAIFACGDFFSVLVEGEEEGALFSGGPARFQVVRLIPLLLSCSCDCDVAICCDFLEPCALFCSPVGLL